MTLAAPDVAIISTTYTRNDNDDLTLLTDDTSPFTIMTTDEAIYWGVRQSCWRIHSISCVVQKKGQQQIDQEGSNGATL